MKSWWLQQLAVDVASGQKWHLGAFDVEPHAVIMIDQDSPPDVFTNRLERLAAGLGVDLSSLPIDTRPMSGFLLGDDQARKQLIKDIEETKLRVGRPVLVTIDSLNQVMLGYDMDRTTIASRTTGFWNQLKIPGATVLLTHHFSLKKEPNWKTWDISGLSMGNTMLVAGSDSIYSVFRVPPDRPTRFVIKAQERRVEIPIKGPFTVQLKEDDERTWARLTMIDELPREPSKVANRIFPLFSKHKLEQTGVNP